MAVENIVYYPDPALKGTATDVAEIDESVFDLLENMEDTLRYYDGLGLAANQIGSEANVFILDESKLLVDVENEEDFLALQQNPYREFINPVVLEKSEQTEKFEEGCLSMPGVRVNVPRSIWIKIQAQDATGETFEYEAVGYHAAAIQHEMDHLAGYMHIDRSGGVSRKMALKGYKKLRKAYSRFQKMQLEQ